MDEPICELLNDGENTFVLVDGVRTARRGAADTIHAIVRDIHEGTAIEVRFEGARIH